MSMAAILISNAVPFEQSVNIHSTEGLMWNLVKFGQVDLKKMFINFMVLYLYIAQEQGACLWGEGVKVLIRTKAFYYFNNTL